MTKMALPLIPPALAQLDSLESANSAVRVVVISHHAETLPPLLRAVQTGLIPMGMHRDSAYMVLFDSVRRETSVQPAMVGVAPPQLHLEQVRRLLEGYRAIVAKGKRA